MFNIELWRPRETFLVLCPFLPLNAQNFIFYAVDILYQFVLSQFFYYVFFSRMKNSLMHYSVFLEELVEANLFDNQE
jgi:hypothetical protein